MSFLPRSRLFRCSSATLFPRPSPSDLGIADLITNPPKIGEDLAAATSTHALSLYRLLRALASIEVFDKIGKRRFTLTPLAACLRSDAPDSIQNTARLFGLRLVSRCLGEMLHCVKTGMNEQDVARGV